MRGALRQERFGQKPRLTCDGRGRRGQKRDTDRGVGLDLQNLVDEVRQGFEVIERLVEELDLKGPGTFGTMIISPL
jgi:YD repeat-containing protein